MRGACILTVTYTGAIYADQSRKLLEAHLLDFSGDLYDKEITVEIGEKIREARRFKDNAEARETIADDIARVREYGTKHQYKLCSPASFNPKQKSCPPKRRGALYRCVWKSRATGSSRSGKVFLLTVFAPQSHVAKRIFRSRIYARDAFENDCRVVRQGTIVNLERSLTLNDYIDGHVVQGHVDARARVVEVVEEGTTRRITIEIPKPSLPMSPRSARSQSTGLV